MTEARISALSQLRWRCRRGMLELDLLLNVFLDKKYVSIDIQQKELFEVLLDYPDQVLFDLLMNKMQAADDGMAELVKLIRNTMS